MSYSTDLYMIFIIFDILLSELEELYLNIYIKKIKYVFYYFLYFFKFLDFNF
jgi:hypothetical protein